MRLKGTPNGTVGWLSDPNFVKMVKRLKDCSANYRGGCDYCPHQAKCLGWWDVICGRLEDRMMRSADYAFYIVEFERIRNNGDAKVKN